MKIEIPFSGVLCVEEKDTEKALIEVAKWTSSQSELINNNEGKLFYIKIIIDSNHPFVLMQEDEEAEKEKAIQDQTKNLKPFLKKISKIR